MVGARDRVLKGGSPAKTVAEKRAYVRDRRPRGLSVAQGWGLMGIARSTYYGGRPADRCNAHGSTRPPDEGSGCSEPSMSSEITTGSTPEPIW
jgi:hypothetical protein